MKKVRSAKKLAIRYFGILMTVVIACLLLSIGYSIWAYRQQLQYCNEATQTVVLNNLQSTLEGLTDFNQEICSSDMDFSLLSYESRQITVEQKMQSLYQLRRMITNRAPSTGAILLFNQSGSVSFYRYGKTMHGSVLTQQDLSFMHTLPEYLSAQPDTWMNQWQGYESDGNIYLLYTCRLRELYICSVLDLNAFSQTYVAETDNIRYLIYNNDRILTNREYAQAQHLTAKELCSPTELSNGYPFGKNIVQTAFLSQYGIGLASVIPVSGIWDYSRIYMTISLVTLVLICLTFSAIYSLLNQVLIYPLQEITTVSRRLASPEDVQNVKFTELEEFCAIQTALDGLLEQKKQLTIENESRRLEKEHARLQYYQLQTRSHFFLNCLKSLYSMTEKGETEKTKRMILCFSGHLRYIFHDTLSLVTLEEELAEVNDYHQIIQLDRYAPLLLDISVPSELFCCRIPPLTIQTFMENSYKYNSDGSKLLRFHVQADQIELEGKAYLRLRLSDNGKGYSPEVLASLESIGEVFETHHVGIKNLRRRIGILYHGDYQIAFRNGYDGGAVTVIYLPIEGGGQT